MKGLLDKWRSHHAVHQTSPDAAPSGAAWFIKKPRAACSRRINYSGLNSHQFLHFLPNTLSRLAVIECANFHLLQYQVYHCLRVDLVHESLTNHLRQPCFILYIPTGTDLNFRWPPQAFFFHQILLKNRRTNVNRTHYSVQNSQVICGAKARQDKVNTRQQVITGWCQAYVNITKPL